MYFYEWGVDSSQSVTEDTFQCVIRNLGYPRFWGRYLTRVSGVSEGLSEQEAFFIHSKGIKILPIYNAFREAIGYLRGIEAAEDAVFHAQSLGIPIGTPLFANIERFFGIDKEWILGWTEAIVRRGYVSGIYNDPVTGEFNQAFCSAVNQNERVKQLTILWSAEPELAPSGAWDSPSYRPAVPACGGNVPVWQYSRDTTQCPVDMNLAEDLFVGMLW
ncbi:MAG: hypothetical protein K0Q48_1008 [Bacillota bacterium]|jgi:hypothetical protein|nr:hypothetical protein [Bacillota bacterium]